MHGGLFLWGVICSGGCLEQGLNILRQHLRSRTVAAVQTQIALRVVHITAR